jgi:N-acetylmuramoyl-L-alanine amidase
MKTLFQYRYIFGLFIGLFVIAPLLYVSIPHKKYETAEEKIAEAVAIIDKDKAIEIQKANDAEDFASGAIQKALDFEIQAQDLKNEASKSILWANECRKQNMTGTTSLANDCDTIQIKEPLDESMDIIEEALKETSDATDEKELTTLRGSGPIDTLFLFYGHGMHDNGKWTDNGAVLDDGTNERSLIMAIGDTVKNLVKPRVVVGREPNTLRDNIAYALSKSKENNCEGRPCYLVSIHSNLSEDPTKTGAVIYYNDYDSLSKEFAQKIQSCFPSRILPDSANRFGRLAVVRDIENVNGVLIETGYMSNAQNLEYLKSKAGSDLAKCLNSIINK